MSASLPSPIPRAALGAAGPTLPAKQHPINSVAANGDRYRFAKWRAPGR